MLTWHVHSPRISHYPAHHLTFCDQPVQCETVLCSVQCLRPSSWYCIMECGAEWVSQLSLTLVSLCCLLRGWCEFYWACPLRNHCQSVIVHCLSSLWHGECPRDCQDGVIVKLKCETVASHNSFRSDRDIVFFLQNIEWRGKNSEARFSSL